MWKVSAKLAVLLHCFWFYLLSFSQTYFLPCRHLVVPRSGRMHVLLICLHIKILKMVCWALHMLLVLREAQLEEYAHLVSILQYCTDYSTRLYYTDAINTQCDGKSALGLHEYVVSQCIEASGHCELA